MATDTTAAPTLEELRRALEVCRDTGGLEPFWRRANRLLEAYAAEHNITRAEAKALALVR